MISHQKCAALRMGFGVRGVLGGDAHFHDGEPRARERISEALLIERVGVHLVSIVHQVHEEPDEPPGTEQPMKLSENDVGVIHMIQAVLDHHKIAA